jgi:hypothetical protein
MAFQETNTLEVENLFAASQIMPVVNDKIAVSGKELKRGTLVDASGAAVTSTSEPYGIIAADVAKEDTEACVYLTGEFNASAVILGASTTADQVKAAARKVGIFLK